jgi:cytoskeletal protein RodZ
MGRILVVLLLGAIGGWWWGWITSGLITGHLPTNSDNNNNNSNNNNSNQLSPFHSISNLPHESKASLSSVLPVKMNDNINNNNNNNNKKLRFTPTQQSTQSKSYLHEWLTDDKDVNQLWEDSKCESLREHGKPVPTPQVWNHLRETYEAVMGSQESQIDTTKVVATAALTSSVTALPSNGFLFPF